MAYSDLQDSRHNTMVVQEDGSVLWAEDPPPAAPGFNFDNLIAPGQGYDDAYFRRLWESTPGGIDQKLQAIAAAGLGWAGALDWARQAGVDSPAALNSSGTATAVQQASQDSGGLGGFLEKAIPSALVGTSLGLTGQALATGNDPKQALLLDAAGLAAAPAVAAALPATGLSTLTAAAPAAAPAAALPSLESVLATSGIPGGAAGIAANTGVGAITGAGALTAGGVGAGLGGALIAGAPESAPVAALPDAGVDLGMFNEVGNPYLTGAAAPGATAAIQSAAGGTGSSALGTAAAGAAGVGGGTALSRLLGADQNTADLLSVLGTGGATALGVIGANQQANALESIGNKEDARIREMMSYGAPSRARFEGSFDPNFNIASIPGLQQSMDTSYDTLLRRLSTQGNPFGNPGGLAEAMKYVTGNVALPAFQNYQALNAGAGGLTQYAGGAAKGPDLSPNIGAVNAQGGAYDALGYGLSQITNPRRSLGDYLRSLT